LNRSNTRGINYLLDYTIQYIALYSNWINSMGG